MANHDDEFREWMRDDIKELKLAITAISKRLQEDSEDRVTRSDHNALRAECEKLRHNIDEIERARSKILGGLAVLSAGSGVAAAVIVKLWK